MSGALDSAAVFAALPAPWPDDPLVEIRRNLAASRRKVVILDDDPTGTQTVRDLPVVTCWDVDTLHREFTADGPGFFILTNSRSLTEPATRELHLELGKNIVEAASGIPCTIISRSDSTLRGHFPAETDTIMSITGPADLVIIAPYFEAGGRYTVGNEHYVAEGSWLVPASDTPFARDSVFGYTSSNLPEWVAEKTAGRIAVPDVQSISLEQARTGGPDAVEKSLSAMPRGSVCVANACTHRDIEVIAAAALRLEMAGSSIIYRCAASLVAARVGQAPHPPLEAGAIVASESAQSGGLVVAGSYVPKTTSQLKRLREEHNFDTVELDVNMLLDAGHRDSYLAEAVRRTNAAIRSGRDALVFTSRKLVVGSDATSNLEIGKRVSDSLIHLVRSLDTRPRFLIAKGGITSSDIATRGLSVKRALVAGQILPGIPVWRLGNEAKFPGMAYVVFPGNVGDENALAKAVSRLNESSAPVA